MAQKHLAEAARRPPLICSARKWVSEDKERMRTADGGPPLRKGKSAPRSNHTRNQKKSPPSPHGEPSIDGAVCGPSGCERDAEDKVPALYIRVRVQDVGGEHGKRKG